MTTYIACEVFAFETTTSPVYYVAFGIIAIVLVLLMMYSKYRDRQAFVAQKKKKKAAGDAIDRTPELIHHMRINLGPDRKELKQIGLFFGFSEQQNLVIKKICAEKKIYHPGQVFSDYAKIEQLLGDRLQELATSASKSKETEVEKTTVFLIREAVENKRKTGKRISSSRMVPERQKLSLTLQTGEQYEVELLHNTSTGLICTMAKDSEGLDARIPLWTKIAVFFSVKNDQSYRFPTRLIKYDTDINAIRMVFAHTDSIESLPMRSHSRKDIAVQCSLSPVTVGNVVNGKKTERRFYPSKSTFAGIMQDISAGGCSVQSKATLKPGEYAEIRCILDGRAEDSMIGKIVRIEETQGVNPIMHIQFAKIPRATMNRIFTYIFTDGDHKK